MTQSCKSKDKRLDRIALTSSLACGGLRGPDTWWRPPERAWRPEVAISRRTLKKAGTWPKLTDPRLLLCARGGEIALALTSLRIEGFLGG